MILQAQEEHQLDLEGSPIVGDKQSDMLFGKNAGRRNAKSSSPQHSSLSPHHSSVYSGEKLLHQIPALQFLINPGFNFLTPGEALVL